MTSKSVLKRTRGADFEAPEPVKRKRGRPSDYEPWMLQVAASLAHRGATDEEITETLGISNGTFYSWLRDRKDFLEAVRSAKDAPDERVKRSLFKGAIEGNTTAQIFWLKNRRPQEFRERQEHELIVPVDQPATTPEQLDVRRMALATLALLREAPDAPVIEGSVVAPYDTQEETDDYDQLEEDEAFDL